MKTLIIGLLFVCSVTSGQYLPKEPLIYNEYRGMWLVAAPPVATFCIIHNMNLSTNYYNNVDMYYIRDRQRFTVFLTGMVVTGVTYCIVQQVNKRYYKRHGIARR